MWWIGRLYAALFIKKMMRTRGDKKTIVALLFLLDIFKSDP